MSERSRIPLQVTVNGKPREIAVEPGDTLLTLLRDGLALTGAKRGCNQGLCGACTVLVDGRPVRSCLTVAATCSGAEVETAEGLLEGNRLSALQQALVDQGAVQCGYCTPGFVVACHALLERHPDPTDAEIDEALAGNLCRCGTYVGIRQAVRQAAGKGD